MKKILTVLGARPQFIKASAVSRAILKNGKLKQILVHTGQHFDVNMSDVFFDELGMSKPDYHLDIHGGNHGEMTGRMLAEIEKVLLVEKPDAVLVYGDTNSTLAGALAAAKLHTPVAHVEAGLRSFNMNMPEEVNRILVDRISQWLLTPTKVATKNLANEGVNSSSVMEVGDVMFDVALHYGERVLADEGILGTLVGDGKVLPSSYCLATIHRAENTDSTERLTAIMNALIDFAETMPVILPLHPRTKAVLAKQRKLDQLAQSVVLIDPVGYLDMVRLEKYAALITTDSGGVQKEAFFYRVPCVTLRDETEWVELVENGWNKLASPSDGDELIRALKSSLGSFGKNVSPYGLGNSAELIVNRLVADLK